IESRVPRTEGALRLTAHRFDLDDQEMKMKARFLFTGALLFLATAAHPQADGRFFEAADANGDGVVTRDEYRAARARAFARLDRNGDGYLDDRDSARRRSIGRRAGDRVDGLRAELDTNRDGRISEREFVGGALPGFDRLDADGNGELDAEEIAAAQDRAMSAKRGYRP